MLPFAGGPVYGRAVVDWRIPRIMRTIMDNNGDRLRIPSKTQLRIQELRCEFGVCPSFIQSAIEELQCAETDNRLRVNVPLIVAQHATLKTRADFPGTRGVI